MSEVTRYRVQSSIGMAVRCGMNMTVLGSGEELVKSRDYDTLRARVAELERELHKEKALRKEHGELIGNMQQEANGKAQHLATVTAELAEARRRIKEFRDQGIPLPTEP